MIKQRNGLPRVFACTGRQGSCSSLMYNMADSSAGSLRSDDEGDKQKSSVLGTGMSARPLRTLRTAESTNLQATQMAFSRMERLPRACGACA